MKKRNYTIQQIDEFLENLGFAWVDRLAYNDTSKKYKRATLSNFNGLGAFLYLKNIKNGKTLLALTTVTNDSFVIMHTKDKLDASLLWQDFLVGKENTQTI